MGEAKWLDLETAQELFPDHADDLAASVEDSTDLSTNPDRESKFFAFDGGKHLIRLVDIWYQYKGQWCWSMFTGSMVLDSGPSYLFDEKGKTICRYVMFSCNVDHDGDRYGFVRNMKSAQDEYNGCAAQSPHYSTANSRRLIMSAGTVADVEAGAGGMGAAGRRRRLPTPRTPDEGVKADDQAFDFAGQMKLMENAVQELDNYGPNQALVGDISNPSGRATHLLLQAGMAELGPYILGFKGWKIRVYRTLVQRHPARYWTAEAVGEGDGQPRRGTIHPDQRHAAGQFGNPMINPMTGQPIMVNMIRRTGCRHHHGRGPGHHQRATGRLRDAEQHHAFDRADALSRPSASAAVSILVDASSLRCKCQKAWRDATQQQPDPRRSRRSRCVAGQAAAQVDETQSKTPQ